MLTIERYRRIGKRRKKLRSWIIVFIALLFSFILTSGIYRIVELLGVNDQRESGLLLNNIIVNGKEVILKLENVNYSLSNDIDKLRQVIEKFNASYFSIYDKTKLIVKASLKEPEVVVLNGKGERNLAMNVSVMMITNGVNVVNYGNARKNAENSIIIVRAPLSSEHIKRISSLTGITNVKVVLDSEVLTPTMASIVVILGKDYKLFK